MDSDTAPEQASATPAPAPARPPSARAAAAKMEAEDAAAPAPAPRPPRNAKAKCEPVVDTTDLDALAKRRGIAPDVAWVCCDKCGKWRALPGTTNMKRLEKRKWFCAMNPDPKRNTCDAPEQDWNAKNLSAEDRRVQGFLGGWVKRLRKVDAAEQRLADLGLTRPKKRRLDDVEYIQCCDPTCGKLRAVSSWIDGKALAARGEWFCVMNNWDEAVASCAAPEELP